MLIAFLPRLCLYGAVVSVSILLTHEPSLFPMFHIIKGTFHVKGFQPDGDSIRFRAAKSERWNQFKWAKKPTRTDPLVQIRLEGIDALETHYNGYHQPRAFGIGALEKLLAYLGITDVQYSLSVRTIIAARDGVAGFLAVATVDGFNRPVCLAFPASVSLEDGAVLTSEQVPITDSLNYRMTLEGLVYPTFYTTTDAAIVRHISEATKIAREGQRGVWVIDRSNGFNFWDVRTLYDDILMMPKLFRRMTAFCERYGDISELNAALKKDKDTVRLADGSRTSLAQLIRVTGRSVEMLCLPEELFFLPKA